MKEREKHANESRHMKCHEFLCLLKLCVSFFECTRNRLRSILLGWQLSGCTSVAHSCLGCQGLAYMSCLSTEMTVAHIK